MKKILIFCLSFFLVATAFAQSETVKVNVKKEEIVINKLILTKSTTIDEVIKSLGKPERVEQVAGKDRKYIYDSKGYAFSTLPNSEKKIVETVTITYTYDDDKNVAKEKFQGTLMIDNLTINQKTTTKEIEEKTDIEKFQCFGTMCMTDPKAKGITTMYALTDKNEILQIVFAIKPE